MNPAVDTATVALVMVVYLGVLLLIGWLASRRTHGGEDFHLAGRSLGAWTAGISSTASSESGWVTLGAVGMTYAHGVSGLWFAPGCLLGLPGQRLHPRPATARALSRPGFGNPHRCHHPPVGGSTKRAPSHRHLHHPGVHDDLCRLPDDRRGQGILRQPSTSAAEAITGASSSAQLSSPS